MGSRILLADDSITIQKVVNLTFADEGIEVVAVSSGDIAERRLAEVNPDLVLADIFMPGKNGYELCESIKQNPRFHDVPVVLLVGAFEPFDQVEAKRVLADAHLTKPFESRTLVETVRRLISAAPRTTAPIAPLHAPVEQRSEGRDASPSLSNFGSMPPPRLDLSAMISSPTTPSYSKARSTGELASPSPVSASESIGVGLLELPESESAVTRLTNTTDRFEPMELLEGTGFEHAEMSSPLELDTQEMVLDFEKSEPQSNSALSFEPEPDSLLDVDLSGAGETAESFDRERLDTTRLEMPSGSNHSNSAVSPESGIGVPRATAVETANASAECGAETLLAVDEPLGDVLLDEGIAGAQPLSASAAAEPLALELTEPAVETPPAPTHFDLVAMVEGSVSAEHATMPPVVTATDSPRPVESDGSVSESQPAAETAGADLDWTSPHARAYSTAQLDSVVMPIAAAEFIPESFSVDQNQHHPADVQSVEASSSVVVEEAPRSGTERAVGVENDEARQAAPPEQARFSPASLWSEEEVRFAPIDIEAVPVEETESLSQESSAVETGFSFAAVPEPADARDTQPLKDPTPTNGSTSSGVELSAAAMDEIVRRVVAEMSNSVVRDVAWEVVPDCVERVVTQLTRENLPK